MSDTPRMTLTEIFDKFRQDALVYNSPGAYVQQYADLVLEALNKYRECGHSIDEYLEEFCKIEVPECKEVYHAHCCGKLGRSESNAKDDTSCSIEGMEYTYEGV